MCKRMVSTIFALLMLALPLTAHVDAARAAQPDSELPTIRYGIFGTMIKGALIIIADDLGLDKEEGVDVQLVSTANSADALTSLISGKNELDVWGMQIMPTCTFIANGADLMIFGGNAAEGGAMIAPKGKADQYKDLANLKGKTILGIRGETGILATIGLLQDLGIDTQKDITIKWTNAPSVLEGVIKGEGDVGFLPIEWTYFDKEVGAEVVFQVGERAPNYICCRLATTSKILQERRADFVKVLKASIRAYKVYREDQETSIRILSAFSGQTPEYIKQNVYVDNIKFTPDPYSDAIGPFYEILKNVNIIENPDPDIDINDHIDLTLYKQALDEIIAEYPNEPVYQELAALYEKQNKRLAKAGK